ncbi:hypothetical protein [Acholeplasma hippikon]|uniref:Uncharacterized protein n=1 Tax=Acholeplasma hippikon TaxID=264636 RepID=A0A449BIX0_9MOLU|nr:hypothetical protein [Acholeplasma hippikon]VEU82406.1 Uncharacterised protein [Acholeplasma hippikon]
MEILAYKDFMLYVGKTIEYCQTIEHDIKWLYALMKNGDPLQNMNVISSWTLGNTVFELESLDNSDKNPSLGKKEYGLLKQITGERNYICHQIFRDFLYEPNFMESKAYYDACLRLLTFYKKIEKLQKQIEDFRLLYAKKRT